MDGPESGRSVESSSLLQPTHFWAPSRVILCGPSTFTPFWAPTHFWVPSSFILCGPSTFVFWTSSFVDCQLYVLSDRPLWPRTFHFWGFRPSTFNQFDRPLSLRTVHFHLDPEKSAFQSYFYNQNFCFKENPGSTQYEWYNMSHIMWLIFHLASQ